MFAVTAWAQLSADCGHPELDKRAIRRSLTLLRTGVAAEDRLGRFTAPAIRVGLPFTIEHYQSWARGGIDSGAALTVEHVEALWVGLTAP